MRAERLAKLVCIASAAFAAWAPGAAASTVIVGETTLTPAAGNLDDIGQDNPVFQGAGGGGYVLASPATGTVTSWSFLSAGATTGSMFELRVLRPGDTIGQSWTAVATSSPVAVTTATGTDDINGPFPTSLPIRAGDSIALEPTDAPATPVEPGIVGQDGIRFFAAPIADGATAAIDPASAADNGQIVPVQATVQVQVASPPPPPGPVPLNTHLPVVDGTPKAGQQVLCDQDVWTTFGKAFFTYTWFETTIVRGPLGGFVHTTTQVQSGMLRSFVIPDYPPGATLYCTASATNANGTSQTAFATPVTIQATAPALGPGFLGIGIVSTPKLTVGLAGKLNRIATCSQGSWLHYPTKYRYQWYAVPAQGSPPSSGTPVGTGSRLGLGPREEAQWVVCRVTASNQAGATAALSDRYYVAEPDFGVHVNAIEITQGIQTFELPMRSAFDPAADHVSYHGIGLPWQGQPNTCSGTPPGCNGPNVQDRVELAAGHITVVRVYANSQLPVGSHAMPVIVLSAFRHGQLLSPGPIAPQTIPPSRALPQGGLGIVNPTLRTDPGGAYTYTLPDSWTSGDVTFEAQANPQPSMLQNRLTNRLTTCTSCLEATLFLGPEHFNQTTGIHIDQLDFKVGNVLPAPCGSTPGCDPGVEDPAWDITRAATAAPINVFPQSSVLDGTGIINATSHSETSFPNCVFGCTWSRAGDATDPSHPFYSWQNSQLLGLVTNWADSNDNLSSHYPFGMVPSNFASCCYSGGTTSVATYNATINPFSSTGRVLYGDAQPLSLSIDNRPISGMAHELHHGLGRPHEDQICNGQLSANGFSENWPPANDGLLDGIGLDTSSTPYRIIASSAGTPANFTSPATPAVPIYDYMSYCPLPANQPAGVGLEQNHWISVRNWNRDVEFRAPGPTHGARDDAQGGTRPSSYRLDPPATVGTTRTLAITAVYEIGTHQTEIFSVAPDTGAPTALHPNDTFSIVGLGTAGSVVARAGVVSSIEHTDRSSPEILILAKLPAAGVRRIEVLQDSTQIAREVASSHAPQVKLVALRGGARIGGPRGAAIRWRSHDVDGGQLEATVRYSPDGGRTWHTVYMGPDSGQAVLPSGFLSASRNARVRVFISDGFNESIVTSPRFVAVGAPPAVSISTPSHSMSVSAGGTLNLAGTGLDDRGARLSGRALTWRAGRRVIGRGADIVTNSLGAGRYTVTLTARDRAGRTAVASVRVTVVPAPPVVTQLRLPGRLSRFARSLTFRIASAAPATLTIGRQRVAVEHSPRSIKVPVRPGRQPLALVLVLRSGRFVSIVPVRLTR